jgi:hypothetical protein
MFIAQMFKHSRHDIKGKKNLIIQSLGFWRMIKYQQSDPEKWSSLMNLMSHQQERSKSKLFNKSVKHLIDKLHLLGAKGCNEDMLSRLLGILDTNSHSLNKKCPPHIWQLQPPLPLLHSQQ